MYTHDAHRAGPERDHLRASDADREAVEATLRRHHGEGRLTMEELADRLARCQSARTLGELRELTADLPTDERDRPAHARRGRAWRASWSPLVLLVAFLAIGAVMRATFGWHGGWYAAPHHGWFPWPLVLVLGAMILFRRRHFCAMGRW
jgi:hypothetical protein